MTIESGPPSYRFGGIESLFLKIPQIIKSVKKCWPTQKETEGVHIRTTREAYPNELSEEAQAFFRGEVVLLEKIIESPNTPTQIDNGIL